MTPAAPLPAAAPPRHPVALGVAVGLALAAHGWLLAGAPRAPGAAAQAPGAAPGPAPVQVRQIVRPGPALGAPVAAAVTAATTGKRAAHAGAQTPRSTQAPAAPATPEPANAGEGADTATTANGAPGTSPSPGPAAGGPALPVYRTRLPPAATLHYQLQRGALAGQATLQWQPGGDGYQVLLQGQADGTSLVQWASQGEFDDAGIAPLRYSESRRGRELRAANFQRGAGRISYSGPAVQHTLVPGAQDRLSWLFQIGAVLAANPGLTDAGAEVAMLVVGSRGDAQAWTFAVLGMEAVALADGSTVQAVHLHRAPHRPYDTHADVWLDPARHHLPVRLDLRVHSTGEGSQYLLQRLDLP